MFKQRKIKFTVYFSLSVIFTILMAASFWNDYLFAEKNLLIWQALFFLLVLIALTIQYILFRRTANDKIVEQAVEKAVAEERTKILSDLEKKEEKTDTGKTEDLSKVIKKIIPGGSFKTADGYAKKLLSNLGKELEVSQGIFYMYDKKKKLLSPLVSYAIQSEHELKDIKADEGLNGQAITSKELMVITDIPEEYFAIESGLGKSKPKSLVFLPIVENKSAIALLELATFKDITENDREILNKISPLIIDKLKTIKKS